MLNRAWTLFIPGNDMPQQAAVFKGPLKGVVRSSAYTDQPADSAIDALNVVPFDILGRLRLRSRPGTLIQYADAIGSGAPVKALAQTTILLANEDTSGFSDEFDYSNGDIDTVSSGIWTQTGNAFDGSPIPNAIVVNSSAVRTSTGQASDVLYTGAPVTGLDEPISITMDFTLPTLVFDMSKNQGFEGSVAGRISSGGGSDGKFVRASVTFIPQSGGAVAGEVELDSFFNTLTTSLPPGTLDFDNPHTLRLEMQGADLRLFVDGTEFLSGTDNTNQGVVGFGFSLNNSSTDATEIITGDNFAINGTVIPTATGRQTNLIAVSNGGIYQGDLTTMDLATGGSAVLDATVIPSVSFSDAKAYFVDGTSIQVLDIKTDTVSAFSATAGDAPVGCRLTATYRDRLVLAAPIDTPQNFFLSRVGTQTDFDFSQEDPAAAFAGNASEFGRIGEPITALMPLSDDIMYIGGDHDLWAMRGDPADGGSIDLVSDSIGVLSNTGWTKSPDGTLYFLGTGGLYKIDPGSDGGFPINLSNERWEQFFRNIDRSSNYLNMQWDRDRQGMYIFVTPIDGVTTGTGVFYDARNGGFWPIQFPTSQGPVSTVLYDGDGPDDRFIFMGSFDGFINKVTEDWASDNGTAISSFIYLGPYTLSDEVEVVIDSLDVFLGEPVGQFTADDANLRVDIQTGQTVEEAYNFPRLTRTRTFTKPRRQTKWITRARGAILFLKLSNSTCDKAWLFEKANAYVMPGGIVRRT